MTLKPTGYPKPILEMIKNTFTANKSNRNKDCHVL